MGAVRPDPVVAYRRRSGLAGGLDAGWKPRPGCVRRRGRGRRDGRGDWPVERDPPIRDPVGTLLVLRVRQGHLARADLVLEVGLEAILRVCPEVRALCPDMERFGPEVPRIARRAAELERDQ